MGVISIINFFSNYLSNIDYTVLTCLLYSNIDQPPVNSLHGLLNCDISGVDCHVITQEYRTRVHCIHLFWNALVHVIYLGVSGQCTYTIVLVAQFHEKKEVIGLKIGGLEQCDLFEMSGHKYQTQIT